ncbi:DinB family protein [Auraticoccus sp. F435]|uniref:DinB family protein n=1 Tax=Auraticoccus cholistanensis TaxID=2656650 RepID=A0A6A9V022_9ACTN|nr:DinB family protein [Auraticoccus cholistanensis]MVA74839.1 DinB family protein [Auraticoccus cholistanensis]
MGITPDTKDWTWVLRQPCAECGFDPAEVRRTALPQRILAATGTVADALAGADVRRRRDPSTWSVLEYGAHVRDVCRVMAGRLALLLSRDDPEFADWDQDATAVAERYAEQDPARVAVELREAADRLSAAFADVPEDAWQRPGRRSNGSVFITWTLGLYALHDLEHHVADVTRR